MLLSFTLHRHAPQNLSMPIMVQIDPINDNHPVVTVETTETYYVENAPPQPVLPDITISDGDKVCDNDQLSAARVQVDTLTEDSQWDQLSVCCVLHCLLQVVLRVSTVGRYSHMWLIVLGCQDM